MSLVVEQRSTETALPLLLEPLKQFQRCMCLVTLHKKDDDV